MRRRSRPVATLLAVALLSTVAPGATAAPRQPPPPPASNGAYASRLFALMNLERRRHGLAPFQRGACATGWAERWSATMAASQRLRHQSVRSIMQSCGARMAGENIAYGNVSADDLMKKWMASRRHRANILNPRFGYAGVGAVRGKNGHWYAVQDFVGF